MEYFKLARGNTASGIYPFRKTTDAWDDYPVRFMPARAYLTAGRVAELQKIP
jgi:hypothetical protein